LPPYVFNIPQEVAALILSEEPQDRIKGMQAMFSGALQAAHRNLRQEYRSWVEAQNKELATNIQQELRRSGEAQSMVSDFYTKFPSLNRPELRSLVQIATQQVSVELGAKAWSPELRDKIGERVFSILSQVVPASAPPESPPPSRVVQHPRMRGASTRPAGMAPVGVDTNADNAHLDDVLEIAGLVPPRTR
jgi:hypothetical protein